MLEERVVARQGQPRDRGWALGPLTVADLESFTAEARQLESEGWSLNEVYGTVRFSTGFTNVKVVATRKAEPDGSPSNND